MFKRLYRILMGAVIAIAAFFVISTISLSDRRSDEYVPVPSAAGSPSWLNDCLCRPCASYAPRTWQYRWFTLDGSLALIYMGVFFSIAWLWRPTANNVRCAPSLPFPCSTQRR